MPVWKSIADKVGRENVLIVIGNSAEAPMMPAYLTKYGLDGSPAVIADREIVGRYYMFTVPKTLLVDADGKVAKVWRGVVTTEAVVQEWNLIVKR